MSDNAWQVCRDGLKPLIQAVSRLEEPDIGKLVEWFRAGAHPFSGLHDDLINVSLKTWLFAGTRTQTSSRREMVRQWLQSNGYEADAREFDTRLRNLIDHLKKWELTATHEADRRKSIWKAKDEAGEFLELLFIIDESGCEALNDVAGEASETRNYLWQLDRSIQDKLGKQDLVTKFQEKLDTMTEHELRKASKLPAQPPTNTPAIAASCSPDPRSAAPPDKSSEAAVCLLNVYTNGLADERLDKASSVLDSNLTVDEKLWKIDELMPIPPTVSGEKLGKALGVSKTAVQNTSWWKQKRKGRKNEKIDQRESRLRKQGKTYERDRQLDDMSNSATGCR